MSKRVCFYLNLTETLYHREQSGITTSCGYLYDSSNTIPASFNDWPKSNNQYLDECIVTSNVTSYPHSYADIKVTTNDNSCNLSYITLSSIKCYESTSAPPYHTYREVKAWAENNLTEYDTNTLNFVRTNKKTTSSGKTTYETMLYSNYSADGKYLIVIFPERWYSAQVFTYTVSQSLTHVTSSFVDGTFNENTPISITLTPETDYIFNEAPTCTDLSATITDNQNGTYSISFTLRKNTQITAVAVPTPATTYTLTQNLTYCSSTHVDGSYAENTNFTIIYTPQSNTVFVNPPTVVGSQATITANQNGTYTVSFTLTANTTITATSSWLCRLTQNLTYVTSNVEDGIFAEGTQLVVTLSARRADPTNPNDSDNEFKEAPTCNSPNALISRLDNSTYQITFTFVDDTIITAKSYAIIALYTTDVQNATVTHPKLYVDNGSYTLTVNANTGYYFSGTPSIDLSDEWGVWWPHYMTANESSTYISSYSITFTSVENPAQPPQSQYPLSYQPFIFVHARAAYIPPSPDPSISDSNVYQIYAPTNANLADLAKERYYHISAYEAADLGEYILRLFRLFCSVPTVGLEDLKLGPYPTDVDMLRVYQEKTILDCGSVLIQPYFNNTMDYENTSIRIYLPFIGFKNLDVAKCMGKTISLKYYVSILSGDALAVIEADNYAIDTNETNIGYEIPYVLRKGDVVEQNVTVNARYLYGFTPFIEIQRDTAYNTASVRATDNKYVLLSTLTGFHTVEVINCTIATNGIENDMLLNRLREGVIF